MKDSFDVLYIVDVGDVDGSGVITAADAAMLLAKVLEGNDIDSNDMNISDYFDVCDVNKDGILTASDAAEILNKTLQIG
jgi:Ca2+-binding EF-hand superfamily protein